MHHSVIGRLTRMFQSPPETEKPKTYNVSSGGTNIDWYTRRDTRLDKYRYIYEQGGLVAEGIDSYPLYILSGGYRLEGRSELIPMVQEFLDGFDLLSVLRQMIVDALVVKKGISEKVWSRDGTTLRALLYRKAETFEELRDDFGDIIGYRQNVVQAAKRTVIDVPKERIFRLDLGLYLIERAYDEIIRDTDIAEGTAKSIKRHGFPRYHIKLGQPGEVIDSKYLSAIGSEFRDLRPQHELTTPRDVDIVNIDAGGVPNVKAYGEWSIDRLCAALGVPNEILGLGRGSTEATANVRLQGFYRRIETLQRLVALQINKQVIDEITGIPGAVRLVFADVSPIDEYMRAQVVQMLTNGIDPWAIVTPEWCREYIGVKLPDEEPDNEKQELSMKHRRVK